MIETLLEVRNLSKTLPLPDRLVSSSDRRSGKTLTSFTST